MVFIYAITALWIAWVWVDYFRLIDIYEREHLKYALLVFLLGGSSVVVVFWLNSAIFSHLAFELNGNALNDFAYYSIRVGAVEEFAKFLPFILFYFFFRAQLNEPIDYFFYACTSALGFAAVENALYFSNYGASIINSRAILSTLGHMMWTGIICYGIIRYKYLHKKRNLVAILGYFGLASLGHGFFNFWLGYGPFQGNGYLVTIAYFLLSVSLFASMLNNAVNNSSFFTYHKVIHASRVARRLFIHYGIIFFAQFVILAIAGNPMHAVVNLRAQIFFPGIIVAITLFRLSRFTLIKNSWEPLPFQFPFQFNKHGKGGRAFIAVQGNAFDDVLAQGYFNQHVQLYPLSTKRGYFKTPRNAYVASKHFLSEDEPAYKVEIQNLNDPAKSASVLLVAKSYGSTFRGEHPIVGIYRILKPLRPGDARQADENFEFLQWGYVVKE